MKKPIIASLFVTLTNAPGSPVPSLQELRVKMHAKMVSLLILLQGMVNFLVLATGEDSTASRSAYFMTQENLRLKGHVAKRFVSASLMSCSHSCLKHAWCTSTNFMAPSRINEAGTCELNKQGTIDIHTQTANSTSTKFDKQQGVTFSVLLKVKYEFPRLSHLHLLRNSVNTEFSLLNQRTWTWLCFSLIFVWHFAFPYMSECNNEYWRLVNS